MLTDIQRAEIILTHVNLVESHMQKIARVLMKDNSATREFILTLLQNSRLHDASKFGLFEFDNLFEGGLHFNEALNIHRAGNMHHPEYWSGIENMPEVYIVEMACDWFARANEFGTDLIQWIDDVATVKYNFTKGDHIWDIIMVYVKILLVKKF